MDVVWIVLGVVVGIPLLLVGLAAFWRMGEAAIGGAIIGFFVGLVTDHLLHLVDVWTMVFIGVGVGVVGAYLYTLFELVSPIFEKRLESYSNSSSSGSYDHARYERLKAAQSMRVSGLYSEQEVLDAYERVDNP